MGVRRLLQGRGLARWLGRTTNTLLATRPAWMSRASAATQTLRPGSVSMGPPDDPSCAQGTCLCMCVHAHVHVCAHEHVCAHHQSHPQEESSNFFKTS